jgi:hypothetical protein
LSRYLRRYSNVPALLYLLRHRKITLLDPASWPDTNDSYFLALYRDKEEFKSVLALCFTQASETFHHWGVFAAGSSGICIEFDQDSLLKAVTKISGIRIGKVKYLTIRDIRIKTLKTRDLPFLKRYPYQDEREFRIVYESKTTKRDTLDISIPLSCIDRITLSPWIHTSLADDLKKSLRDIPGCGRLELARSTLIGNQQWKNAGEKAR